MAFMDRCALLLHLQLCSFSVFGGNAFVTMTTAPLWKAIQAKTDT